MSRTIICLLGLILLAACDDRAPAYPKREPPAGFLALPANQAAGRALFREHCTRCHGSSGEGRSPRAEFFQPPAPDFKTARYRALDPGYLFWRIETGKMAEPFLSRGSVMPAWKPHLSEEQIWQLVAYLRARPAGGD